MGRSKKEMLMNETQNNGASAHVQYDLLFTV